MASRAQAIEAHCKWCIYDELDHGTWREQVENCNMHDCALHPFRPLTVKSGNAKRDAKKAGKSIAVEVA